MGAGTECLVYLMEKKSQMIILWLLSISSSVASQDQSAIWILRSTRSANRQGDHLINTFDTLMAQRMGMSSLLIFYQKIYSHSQNHTPNYKNSNTQMTLTSWLKHKANDLKKSLRREPNYPKTLKSTWCPNK